MAIAPTGNIGLTLYYIREALANSSNFQSWVGESDAAGAKNHIYYSSKTSSGISRPFARISPTDNYNGSSIGSGVNDVFNHSSSVAMFIEDNITESDEADAYFDFINKFDAVMVDMETLSGQANYAKINNYSVVVRKNPWEEDEYNKFYVVEVILTLMDFPSY